MERSFTPTERLPRFLPLVVVIVLPVVVLAVLGFFLLRHDRRITEHGAVERARGIAEDLAPRAWASLIASNAGALELRTDGAGQLMSPSPWQLIPTPEPLDIDELEARQRELWLAIQREGSQGNPVLAYRDFLALDPPSPFAAAMLYGLACAQASSGRPMEAIDSFRALLKNYPDAAGETGLPLGPLAQFQMLRIAIESQQTNSDGDMVQRENASMVDNLCSNLVRNPNGLTSYLFDHLEKLPGSPDLGARVQHWKGLWSADEAARKWCQLVQAPLRRELAAGTFPRAFWMGAGPDFFAAALRANDSSNRWETPSHWLVVLTGQEGGTFRVVCRAETNVAERFRSLFDATRQVPEYMGIGAVVASRPVSRGSFDLRLWREGLRMTRSGGQSQRDYFEENTTNLLGSALAPGGLLNVGVYLTSPSTLLKQTRARTFWMGCVIAVSAGAALAGLVAVHRGMQRQLRLSNLKSNFVSSVSHELRAPTGTILLMAENLERGKVLAPADQQDYFRAIVKECRRLSALIENLLDFSRIEQGRKEYQKESSDMRALVEETTAAMQVRASEHEVRLVRITAEDNQAEPIFAMVDGRAIQQALINLIDNAIKHSPQNETVQVGLECAQAAIQIWVEDLGPGIPAEEHERIFERFYRCGSELRRKTQGVGIGLSIVKHIVESHGGRVLVRSAPGQGSRFTMELPVGTLD